MKWTIKYLGDKPQLNKPILIEGMPGIGNVGKLAIDFIIEETKAKKIAEFYGVHLPHSVFINEKNLVELPVIELYYKKLPNSKHDLLLLAGDAQPNDEASCYEFCEAALDAAQTFNCQQIMTLGGIALKEEPKKPNVYVTGNNKESVEEYAKGSAATTKLYGKVGSIIGVSGLLLGLAQRRNIPAVCMLAETYGHPLHLGITGAREILKILKKKVGVDLDIKLLEKEIKELQELGNMAHVRLHKRKKTEDVNYIG